MAGSGIFLDYHGPVDLPEIESLISQLKESREFYHLAPLTRKRTYSLFIECLENIYKYSALKSCPDKNMQPHISLSNNEGKITIVAGNPVPEDAREHLSIKLDRINNADCAALKKMREKKFRGEAVQKENGTGIGLICMALKSANKIHYTFHPLISGYLYFEIKISLN